MPNWNTRQVGRTALRVTEIGLGTATLAGRRFNIDQSVGQAIVRAAWDAGVRYVDTAPFYGVGAAEHAGKLNGGWPKRIADFVDYIDAHA